ncbi:MAG: hypothetical protein K6T66_14760 [Peptococcaceae bacterium]|nr:hypothetical protein [Peptococcaceae bacterium]
MFNAAVVDPDTGSLEATAGLLARNPHVSSVACFRGYSDFFKEIEKGGIHLAFIRVGSPGFHGLSVARETFAVSPATMVVFMSDTGNYAVAAFEEGACGYLILPAEQKDLDELVDNLKKRVKGACWS